MNTAVSITNKWVIILSILGLLIITIFDYQIKCNSCSGIDISDRYFLGIQIKTIGFLYFLTVFITLVLYDNMAINIIITGLIPIPYFVFLELKNETLCFFCTCIHIIQMLMARGVKGNIDKRIILVMFVEILVILSLSVLVSIQDTEPVIECLQMKGVVEYGKSTCSSCQFQKKIIDYPGFVDCLYEKCPNITSYPTWVAPFGKSVGVMSFSELVRWSNCPLTILQMLIL